MIAFSTRSSKGLSAFVSLSIFPPFPKSLIEPEEMFEVLKPIAPKKGTSILYIPPSLTAILLQLPDDKTELVLYTLWALTFVAKKQINDKGISVNLLMISLQKSGALTR